MMIHSMRDRSLLRPIKPFMSVGMEGIVQKVQLIHEKTGIIVRELGPFPNLIVDAGLNAVGATTGDIETLVEYLGVGTDNTAPAAAQTALGAQVDDRYNGDGGFSDVVASGPGYAYWDYTRTREVPAAYGNGNLTELGFFQSASAGTMWSRMLFLDGGGSPTTLVKTSAEILRVIYTWRLYLVLTPTTDVITIDGISTTCSSRAMRANEADAWGASGLARYLGSWLTDPRTTKAYETNTFPAIDGGAFSGSGEAASSISLVSYGAGTFYRDLDVVFEPGVANFTTGIGAIDLPPHGPIFTSDPALGVTFSPKVGKDNTERFTFRARISWGRH